MWLSEIELVCFKSYQSQVFQFPQPTDGQNVVIIGGMNGYGKTSILEALYLCLYGKDAMVHLARAGLKTEEGHGYPTFLERSFNGEALRDQLDTMKVRVLINKTKTKAIDITRKWYFRSNGSWSAEEEAVIKEVIRGVPQIPRKDRIEGFHLLDVLDNFFVPAHIAPFFFFDGEEVKKLADQSRVEQIKQGLEGLLGVVLLKNLADRLKIFENNKRSGVSSVDEHKLSESLGALENDQRKLKTLQDRWSSADDEIKQLKSTRKDLEERIFATGGGGGDIATVKELSEEREQLRNNLRKSQEKLEDILAGELPFHLISKNLHTTFREQIEGEVCFYEWLADKKSLEPRKLQFQNHFLNEKEPEVDPALTEPQLEIIKSRIDAAWTSLFYPPPDNCSKEILHNYMSPSHREKSLDFLDRLSLGQNEITDLLNEQKDLQRQVDEMGRKITRLEGIDRDGTFKALTDELTQTNQRLDELEEQVRVDIRASTGLEARVNMLNAACERERKILDDSSPVRAVIGKSERIRRIIEQVIPRLFPLKVGQLAESMTSVYKQLAHKSQVAKIEIHDDGTSRVLGKSGKEIPFDRSAGENQIFATALIAGLAHVSGAEAPMVVDTPLGRLDSQHRKNILEFWTADKNRQVILLSQDKEIDPEMFAQIRKSVSKTYLLDHVDVGDGIGRTSARENSYFEQVTP